MPSQFPYDPNSRETAERIDWVRIHPQSMQVNVRRWRRVSLADIQNLMTNPSSARIFEAMPMELKAEFTRRVEHREDADIPPERTKSSKEEILKRVDDTVNDAEQDGDLVAKLRGLELMAKVEQLLSTKERVDPNIVINIVTGVDRG
jgi:hypothetical protein